MIERLTGLCSASTSSMLTITVQHVISIVLPITSLVLISCVDMVFHIVRYSLEQHSSTSTQQKQCRNDWMVGVEPK